MELVKEINPNIFREYDLRGIVPTDINEDVAYTLGKSFGTYLIKELNEHKCVIGHDNRLSNPGVSDALIKGILETGCDVVDLGLCTTPMYYYASIVLDIAPGIMVTASHNPKEYNGFKIAFDRSGNACGEMIYNFRDYTHNMVFLDGNGELSFYDIKDEYFELMKNSINMGDRKVKAVIDSGNGTTSLFVKELFGLFNMDITYLFAESDGNFPNHTPDPSVESYMESLKKAVVDNNADVGIAFDGDGDRVGIVLENGKWISADMYMIMLVRDIFKNSSNKKVLADVKCTKSLSDEIEKLGGEYICYRTGNSYTKRETRESNCVLGGELSGHLYFRDKFPGFDSGMYAGLRMLELLSKTDKKASELLEGINVYYSTPEIKVDSTEEKKFGVIDKVKEYAKEKGYNINDIDGVRVDFPDGWALVRASNTTPCLTLRFEGVSEEVRDRLKDEFMEVVNKNL